MKRVCAWCRKELEYGKAKSSLDVVTHGICSPCALEVTQGIRRSAQEISAQYGNVHSMRKSNHFD